MYPDPWIRTSTSPTLTRQIVHNPCHRGSARDGLFFNPSSESPSTHQCEPAHTFVSRTKIAPRDSVNVGRNEPCPCGSGKKYKKCCLAKDQSQRDQLTPRLLTSCSEEATDALLAHAHHTLGDGFLNDAWREFWAEDDELFIPDSPYNMLLIPWALYLWVAGSGGTGRKRWPPTS